VASLSVRFLTTSEAAKFLRASPASIRRWSDDGLLPVSRVGRRRARRFREDDLLRLMSAQAEASAPVAQGPQVIQIQGMGVALGSHLASFYATDAGRLRLGLPFLRDGILAGHACLIRAAPPVRDYYLRALKSERVDVAAAMASGLLAFMPDRRMSVSQWIAAFERLVAEATRAHPGPLRFLGEGATGIRSVAPDRSLLALEQQLGPIVKRLPMVMLCPFDVRVFEGVMLLDILKLHYDTFSYQPGYFLN
jgi:excisionase family DNA binding protein